MPPSLTSTPLGIALSAFLAGLLVALGFLSLLAYRPLRDRVLSLAGLFGLLASAAWLGISGLAATLLPAGWGPLLPLGSLILAAVSLVTWERVIAGLLAGATQPWQAHGIRRVVPLVALLVVLLGVFPGRVPALTASALLCTLACFLALLTLVAGLAAYRKGIRAALPLSAAALGLLVSCSAFWGLTAGWLDARLSQTLLHLALVGLTVSLGWAMLIRMTELRQATERAQAAQLEAAALQAQLLEAQVDQRSAELSDRLRELEEARQSAETANRSLRRVMEQLEAAASTDRLTGAWNRRRFEETVHAELALAKRRREPLSLILLDLDHFKRVNDSFGHGTGDMVLAGTAQTLRLQLRASDALVRWGGEEFIVLAPATRLAGAAGLAEKLRSAVAAVTYPDVGPVTVSLGVAEYVPGEGLEEWLGRADQALYRAKAEGRNRVCQALPPDGAPSQALHDRPLLEVVWEDGYASGHGLIDRQHERLFDLASALLTALTEERPLSEIRLRLETLLAHTAQHFHDEEQLLRAAQYPDVTEHMAVHARLLNRAWNLQTDVQSGHLDVGRLITFLALDLVKGHILTEDRNYFNHLLQALGPEGLPLAGA